MTIQRATFSLLALAVATACAPAPVVPVPGATVAGPGPAGSAPAATTPVGNTPVAPTPAAPQAEPVELAGEVVVAGKPVANATITVRNAITGAALTVAGTNGGPVTTDAQGRFSVLVSGVEPASVVTLQAENDTTRVSGLMRGDGKPVGGAAAMQLLALKFNIQLNEVSTAMALTYAPFFALLDALAGNEKDTTLKNLLNSADKNLADLDKALKTKPDAAAQVCLRDGATGRKNVDVLKEILTDSQVKKTLDGDLATMARQQTKFGTALQSLTNSADAVIDIKINSDGTLQIGDVQISLAEIDLVALAQDLGADNNRSEDVCGLLTFEKGTLSSKATFAPELGVVAGSGNGLTIAVSQNEGEHDIKKIVAVVPAADVSFNFSKTTLGTVTTDAAGAVTAVPNAAERTMTITGAKTSDTSWSGELNFAGGSVKVGKVNVTLANNQYTVELTNVRPSSSVDGQQLPVNFGHATTLNLAGDVFSLKNCTVANVAFSGQTAAEVAKYTVPLTAGEGFIVATSTNPSRIKKLGQQIAGSSSIITCEMTLTGYTAATFTSEVQTSLLSELAAALGISVERLKLEFDLSASSSS